MQKKRPTSYGPPYPSYREQNIDTANEMLQKQLGIMPNVGGNPLTCYRAPTDNILDSEFIMNMSALQRDQNLNHA